MLNQPVRDAPHPFDFGRTLFAFDGRLNRPHFWMGWGLAWLAGLAFGLVAWLGGLLLLPLIWVNTALSVKRLHDAGRTGWWAALPPGLTLGAVVFAVVSMMTSPAFRGGIDYTNMEQGWAVWGSVFLIPLFGALASIVFMVWVGLLTPDPAPNRFGPPPDRMSGE